MPPSDSARVSATRAGDRAAFGALLDRHRPRQLHLIFRRLGEGWQYVDAAGVFPPWKAADK